MKKTVVAFLLLGWASSCEVFIYDVGKEDKPCFGNGTCEKGLYCCHGICRREACGLDDGGAGDGWDGEDFTDSTEGGDLLDAADSTDATKQCVLSSDCDDHNICTNDICDPNTNTCVYVAIQNETFCTDNLDNDCDGKTDSQDTDCKECSNNQECDDGNACTTDSCVSRYCQYEIRVGEVCDDGRWCTENDKCSSSGQCIGKSRDCSDDNDCTYDYCDEEKDQCVNQPIPNCQQFDGGLPDAGQDGGDGGQCLPVDPPRPLLPHNGAYTGSIFAPAKSLKPQFRWIEPSGIPCSGTPYKQFHIQVDDSCQTPGFGNCSFPSPEIDRYINATTFIPDMNLEVSQQPPVGRRYYWRVRACCQMCCTSWSEVRYVNVGRLANDFNGDGYSDVVVGASYYDDTSNNRSDVGRVFVFFGSSFGLPDSPNVTLTNPVNKANDLFGTSVAFAGDVNADGFSDIVVGAPQTDDSQTNEGKAYVFYGSSSVLFPQIVLPSPQSQEGYLYFGHSVASAGDVNGDGYDDIIVGAYGWDSENQDEGSVFIYHGRGSTIGPEPSLVLDNPTNQPSSYFGHSVATAGDVNGDGFSDIIVGAWQQDAPEQDEGNAFVFYGSDTGIVKTNLVNLDNPTGQEGGGFGFSVSSAGDINGDGYSDVLVGAVNQQNQDGNFREGNVFVYLGSPLGIGTDPSFVLDNPQDQAQGAFGNSVACAGDVNGDNLDDIVIGAYRQDLNNADEGKAFVYYGASSGLSPSPSVTLENPDNKGGGMFGFSVSSAGDVNGDGYSDIVVGAIHQDKNTNVTDVGKSYVYCGSNSGLSATACYTLTGDQTGGWFGSSVASVLLNYKNFVLSLTGYAFQPPFYP